MENKNEKHIALLDTFGLPEFYIPYDEVVGLTICGGKTISLYDRNFEVIGWCFVDEFENIIQHRYEVTWNEISLCWIFK